MFRSSTFWLTFFGFLFPALVTNAYAQLFASKVDYMVGSYPFEVASADFNNDGYIDLATTSDTFDWVTILMNNGDGTFHLDSNYVVGNDPTIALADFDNDGDIDIAAPSYSGQYIYVLLNSGNGTFCTASTFFAGGVSNQPCAPDLNGDGYPDLVVPNYAANRIAIFFNNGDTTFTGFSNPVFYSAGAEPYAVRSADLDNDNDSDLVVPNAGLQTVSVFFNDSAGTHFTRVDYGTGIGVYPHTPSIADYNGDGCPDLAVANRSPSTPFVSVLFGNCSGDFDSTHTVVGCRPHSVASADFDLDGDIDIASPDVDCSSISIFLNDGNGFFALNSTLPAGVGPGNVVAVDFDNDGDVDLAANAWGTFSTPDNRISVLMNLTIVTSVSYEPGSPKAFSLDQNYPNPFNPSTRIGFSVASREFVSLKVYSLLGQEVVTLVNEMLDPGNYEVTWDTRQTHVEHATELASGVYFYQLKTPGGVETKKLMLLK